MITKDEALKLALKALEPDVYTSEWVVQEDVEKAIYAIKMVIGYKTDWYIAINPRDMLPRFYQHHTQIPHNFQVLGTIKLERL